MYISNREEYLDKNELTISTIIDIIENKVGYCVVGNNNGLLVWTDNNKEYFSAIIKGDKIKIININGEKTDILIQKNENKGYIINKDLNCKFEYNIEELDNNIEKINIYEKIENDKLYQSYLRKSDDIELIMYNEMVDKENYSVSIFNSKLINASKEDIQAFAEEVGFGEEYDDEQEPFEDDESEEEQIDEDEYESKEPYEYSGDERKYKEEYRNNDYDDNEIEDDDCNKYIQYETEDSYEEENEEDLEELYNELFYVIENKELIEGGKAYEIIESVYSELAEWNVFTDYAIINNIEYAYDELLELSKSKDDMNKNIPRDCSDGNEAR